MPVKLIIHPHYHYDPNGAFIEATNRIAKQENAFVIKHPDKPTYVENPKNDPIPSIRGEIPKDLVQRILEDGHVFLTGGVHGFCPYDYLNTLIIGLILNSKENLVVDFPMDFIYCQVENIGNIPYLNIGELGEDIVGEWTPHLVHEKDKPGRKRLYVDRIPIFNRYVYDSGTYILSTALFGLEIQKEDVFRAYINLVNLWINLYTSSLLRRADLERKLGKVQLRYETGFERSINSFTIDITKEVSPFPN